MIMGLIDLLSYPPLRLLLFVEGLLGSILATKVNGLIYDFFAAGIFFPSNFAAQSAMFSILLNLVVISSGQVRPLLCPRLFLLSTGCSTFALARFKSDAFSPVSSICLLSCQVVFESSSFWAMPQSSMSFCTVSNSLTIQTRIGREALTSSSLTQLQMMSLSWSYSIGSICGILQVISLFG